MDYGWYGSSAVESVLKGSGQLLDLSDGRDRPGCAQVNRLVGRDSVPIDRTEIGLEARALRRRARRRWQGHRPATSSAARPKTR